MSDRFFAEGSDLALVSAETETLIDVLKLLNKMSMDHSFRRMNNEMPLLAVQRAFEVSRARSNETKVQDYKLR